MNSKNIEKIISEALAIEREEASRAGAIGYMARALIQATMPHSNVPGNEFQRKNGAFNLSIIANSQIGLPYGSVPRLILSWITTEAVKTQSKEIILGRTLSKFMVELGLIPSGGRWGTITRLKDQMKRLFSASISCIYDDGKNWGIRNVTPVEEANLWWDPKQPDQATIWESNLTLGDKFFKEIISSPVPIDMRALKALKQSPMALDIYCWLTYRMSYLRKITPIPWEALEVQFGANYKDVRQFKRRFIDQLKKVMVLYPEARLQETTDSLTLLPSKPHVQFKLLTPFGEDKTKAKPPAKPTEDELQQTYTHYKLQRTLEIVENELEQTERHKLLTEFDDYLIRTQRDQIRAQIKKGIHDEAVKAALYQFVNSRWHHLTTAIQSFEEFSETAI